MEVRFLETAQIELDEVVDYYNSEFSGLGDELLLEVLKAIERIINSGDTLLNPGGISRAK